MITKVLPLSPLQAGMLYHATADESSLDVYTMQSCYRFDKALDAQVLATACATLLRRHPILTAGFTARSAGEPVAFLADDTQLLWREVGLSAAHQDAHLARLQRSERTQRFELAKPPLIRFVLARTGPDSGVLVVTNHHILYDGWSDALIVTELLRHYIAGGEDHSLPSPPPFSGYLHWLRRQPESAAAPWAEHLSGLRSGTLVAPDADLPATALPAVLERELSVDLTEQVTQLAHRCGVTSNTIFTALWGLALRHVTGSDDVVLGLTVSGRPPQLDRVDEMIGLFLNTVPMRVQVKPALTVRDWLRQLHQESGQLAGAHHVPLPQIQQRAGVGTLFDTLYVMRNTPMDDAALDELSAQAGLGDLTGGDATHYPLTFIVHPGERTTLMLSYRTDAFSQAQIEELLDYLTSLLAAMTAQPDAPLGQSLAAGLPPTTKPSALVGKDLIVPPESLVEMLAAQGRKQPNAVALLDADGAWSFGELTAHASKVAAELLALGVQPGDRVAIDLPRGCGYVAAIFGILAVRAAYVPLDHTHPQQRRDRILATCAPKAVVDASLWQRAQLAADQSRPTDSVTTGGHDLAQLVTGYSHDDLAYVMFTSGSTGDPKGVAIRQSGLVNMLVNHRLEIFSPALASITGPQAVVAHTVSFAFDMSWEELLWLVDGHVVHIMTEELRRDPVNMVAYIKRYQVDVINVTPTVCSALITAGMLTQHCPALVLLGGEPVSPATWTALVNQPGTLGYNLYGPTEYTINTLGGGTDDSPAPIVGLPISNTTVQLLDSALLPVPQGHRGELYVQGTGIAVGYSTDPAATAASFVASAAGQRWYRTGDIARINAAGLIEFCGRADDQVKIRGLRIEPAEVASALEQHPAVAQCTVRALACDRTGTRLVAYVVPQLAGQPSSPDSELDSAQTQLAQQLQQWAKSQLPGPMIPSAVVLLDHLPLTSQGKLATHKLPIPAAATVTSEPGRTNLERRIAQVFADVLQLPSVGRLDDFFALGGHSISAMSVVSTMREKFHRRVPLATLMQASSPAALAASLSAPETDQISGWLTLRTADVLPTQQLPLVCLSPASGLGWSYRSLLGQVGSRSVTAIQAPVGIRPQSMQAYAEQLSSEVQSRFNGPVHLLGWSFGGMVAHQMTEYLADQVASLAIVDAVPLLPETDVAGAPTTDFTQEALDFVVHATGRERPAWLTAPFDQAAVLEFVAAGDDVWSELSADQISQILANYEWSSVLMTTAKPPVVQMPTYLATAQHIAAPTETPLAQQWSVYCDAELKTEPVAAGHHDMLTPVAVGQWGPSYFTFLDQIEKSRSTNQKRASS